jgi:transmembrane sensor
MSAGEHQTIPNKIDLEALGWLALMDRGPLPPEGQARFAAWLAADIRHQGAIVRAPAASLRLDRLAAFAGGRSVLEPFPNEGSRLQRHISRRGMIATAASAVGLIGAWLGRGRIEETWGGTWYASGVGDLKKIALADGSVITMNTQTLLRVRYTGERRDIYLVRGEALFAVMHDAKRPFAVRVGEWTAVAVGTAFAVRQLDDPATAVTVTEGIVQLLPVDRRVYGPRLTVNQKALIGAANKAEVCQVSDTEIGQQLAWRTRLVVFTGERLRQALAEMNRYSRRRIVVADPALAERRIKGVFSTTDTPTFVSAMTATLGVQAVGSGDVVLLRRVN